MPMVHEKFLLFTLGILDSVEVTLGVLPLLVATVLIESMVYHHGITTPYKIITCSLQMPFPLANWGRFSYLRALTMI